MNCDQVFSILTRGPFPSGHPDDASVERHLSACHECRALAAALEPAVQLFHEALSSGEACELPGYRGRHRADAVSGLSPALQDAIFDDAPAVTASVAPFSKLQRQDAWRLAAVLGWGALLALLVAGVFWQAPRHALTMAAGAKPTAETRSVRFQPTASGRQWLAALNLPTACFHAPAITGAAGTARIGEPQLASGAEQAEMVNACCLNCHGEQNANRPPLDAQASLDRTCHVCHNY